MEEPDIDDIWAAITQIQPPRPVEFRLYYDSDGKVVCYTCEDLPGQYIVLTREQYAEARPDVLVREGRIIYTHTLRNTYVLERNSSEGVPTSKYDVNIIVSSGDTNSQYWKLVSHEFT